MSFLPKNYEVEIKQNRFIRKFEEGKHKFKFIGEPLLSWIEYVDSVNKEGKEIKKALRIRYNLENQKAPSHNHRQAITAVVWNHDKQLIEVFDLTQKAIISAMIEKEKNGYDLTICDCIITRKGKDIKDTTYIFDTLPDSKTMKLDPVLVNKEMSEIKPNLELLFTEKGYPFEGLI